MSDNQSPQATPRRGGRRNTPRGSARGRRGGRQPRAPDGAAHGSTPAFSSALASSALSPASHNHPSSSQEPNRSSSRGNRGSRGGRGRRGRGGGSVQQSSVVPQRSFGGHLTSNPNRGGEPPPGPALSADAPEFVPGYPSTSRPAGAASRQRPRPDQEARAAASAKPPPKAQPGPAPKSSAADLPTRIHQDIDSVQYECVICTGEVLRNSRIWSCTICWTVTHLHCVKKWHANQIKNQEENPSPEPTQQPRGWRCPGCNSSLQEEPGAHHCWCGKEINAKSVVGLPPHSCGQTCSKPRATCPHPCTLMCHAGPCPPCTLMGPSQTCFCGKNTSTKRCSETDYGAGWSCQEPCGDLLPCGEHACSKLCHSGLCGSCKIPIRSACYCGKEERDVPCDQRDAIHDSFAYERQESLSGNRWFEGSFVCGNSCGRKFDCGHHACEKACHPQDEQPAPCPYSPSLVTRCSCGKTPLDEISREPRLSCLDPIPHCDKACDRPLGCGHFCLDKCHTGPCKPCMQTAEMSCRCGRTATRSLCHQGDMQPPQCFRICRAQLNCGRHECGEHCCPGEKKAAERRRQKRGGAEFEAEHICVQVCDRKLKCGKHTCQQLCHRGACASCPEAVFDEIACACGRTVLYPPQPCGTRPPECRFDCTRPRACGHPTVSHQCHPEDAPCPKCPFLVEKACVCGKKEMRNQPCWFDEVRCGLPCGRKLKCGAHECAKTCHRPGQCEDDRSSSSTHCTQPCGKTRRSCDHACVDPCHAPYACKEDRPCQSKTFVTCPCQRRKQEIRCQASRLNPWPQREPLRCDDECLQLQRNRRLADALHIDPDTLSDDHVPYSDATLRLFRDGGGVAWAEAREREFRVFAADRDEKRLRFKPMAAHQRAFLHALAEDFGLDSESLDPEPHRHVCVFKTPRFVSAPRKTLAQCLRIVKAGASAPPVTNTSAGSATGATTGTPSGRQPFNSFLLTAPRFGLTVDEVDEALSADLAGRGGPPVAAPALRFETSFLPSSDEIVVRAVAPTATTTAASIAAWAGTTPTPQAIEDAVTKRKSAIAATVARLGIAGSVSLCRADGAPVAVTRREGDGGWSTVVSRGAWKRPGDAGAGAGNTWGRGIGADSDPERRAPRSFVALRKTAATRQDEKKKKKQQDKEVEEDWFAAAERLAASDIDGGLDGPTVEESGVEKDVGEASSSSSSGSGSINESGGDTGLERNAARAPELVTES